MFNWVRTRGVTVRFYSLTLGCRLVEMNEDQVFPRRQIEGVVIRVDPCQVLHVKLQHITVGVLRESAQH